MLRCVKVLVAHNRHRSRVPSGENRAVDNDVALLRSAGVEVETYFRSNDEIDGFGLRDWAELPLRASWSRRDMRDFSGVLRDFHPDVVHVHNLLPLLSPALIRVAKDSGTPVVQTVHNYLPRCLAGTYFRAGAVCHDCRDSGGPWPGVAHACYHGSRAQSAALATALVVHRGTWRLIVRFLAISPGVARHLEETGVPPERVTIHPNHVPDPGSSPSPGRGFLFLGRLRGEKGIGLLLDAWRLSGLGASERLVIAGDGPQRGLAEAASGEDGIEYVGQVSRDAADRLVKASGIVVVPSLWEEPFGLSTVEAMAMRRPVLATRMGASAWIVGPDRGWVVEPDVAGMAEGLQATAGADLEAMGAAARRHYEEYFSPPQALARMLRVYDSVSAEGAP
jgi:glycosyltransferase involved in cell wall biosynthesis